jgi:hypothetical protein
VHQRAVAREVEGLKRRPSAGPGHGHGRSCETPRRRTAPEECDERRRVSTDRRRECAASRRGR